MKSSIAPSPNFKARIGYRLRSWWLSRNTTGLPLHSDTLPVGLFFCGRWLGSRSQDLLLLFLALPLGFLSRPQGFLGSRPQGNPTGMQEVQAAKTLSLGVLPLAQPLRLLGSNAPGLFFHAETLRLLHSCPQSLLLLARPLRLLASLALRLLHSRPQARPQGPAFLSLGLMSCNATGLLLLAETLSLGLLLPVQPLRLLGSSALGQLCFVCCRCWRRWGEACGR